MARKSTRELLNENIRGFTKLENEFQDAVFLHEQYKRELANARRRLTRKKNSTYPDKLFEEIRNQLVTSGVMENYLIFAIDRAAEQNTEFEHELYKKALYKVAADTDIYKLFKVGQGWGSNLNVQIVFEAEAGTLTDWARGISLFRDEMGVEPKDARHRAGFKATMFWIEKVFGTSKEGRTIHSRLVLSSRKAPFWQILNNGSQPLDSDRRDGSFNPFPAGPTDFVGDAEIAIKNFFLRTWLPEKNKWLEETLEAEEAIQRYQDVLVNLEFSMSSISTRLEQNERIYRQFGESKKYIDKNKLSDVLDRLRAGERFEKQRIELTKSGSEFRVRPTVRKLEGLLDD